MSERRLHLTKRSGRLGLARSSLALLGPGCLALAGCATPEMRLRDGLVDAGLNRPLASCMAGRMVDRLSLGQLMKIGRLEKLKARDAQDISWEQFLRNTRALQDPEILSVASSSGAVCLLGG